MTLGDAIQLFIDARVGVVSNKTLRINSQYLGTLETFLGSQREIESVSIDDLRAWRKQLVERKTKYGGTSSRKVLKEKLSKFTIHGHVRNVKQFVKWFFDEGRLDKNPALRLEQVQTSKGPRRGASEDDFQKMLHVARHSPRNVALLWLFHDTGARLGGLTTLELCNVDLNERRALVWEKGRGGEQVSRFVYLKPQTIAALCAYLALRSKWLDVSKARATRLFLSERKPHRPLTKGAIYRAFKRIGKQAGVTARDNPQAFRHGFAARVLDNGGSLGLVSTLLDHSSIKVTDDFYAGYGNGEAREGHARYA